MTPPPRTTAILNIYMHLGNVKSSLSEDYQMEETGKVFREILST